MPKDKYANFSALSLSETQGSYRIECRQNKSEVALIAPHGGNIEPGTSKICKCVAGADLSYYLFEGTKPSNNTDLHITSARFDEPKALAIASSAKIVLTFHGQRGSGLFINVGGLADVLGKIVINQLTDAEFTAERQANNLQGLDRNNICNRSSSNQGVQLEISRGLRDVLVRDSSKMDQFASAIRAALQQYEF